MTIAVSSEYVADRSISQGWADFFARLPQSRDAESMVVYFAPLDEMQSYCSTEAAACYSPRDKLIVLDPDAESTDGVLIEEIAAHEFAHHIAARRNNDPWNALDWGPKRWASASGICPGVLEDEFMPGDEESNYRLNPGEGWAEAYRVAAGGSPALWPIVDPVFFPDEDGIAAALNDAKHPWLGNRKRTWTGKLNRKRSRVRRIRINTPLDGRFVLSVQSSKGSDVDLFITDETDEALIDRAVKTGRTDSINAYVCGDDQYYIYVVLASKHSGSYQLSLSSPS